MQLKRHFRYVVITCIALFVATLSLIAAEYRGQVKFNTLPLPGAQVTATQGDKKMTAVSDEQGNFAFQDLPDGAWQLQVDMLGFTPAKQEITQGTGLPGPSFELKMLPLDEIKAETAPAAPVAPATTTAPAQTTTATPTDAPTPSLNASIAAANAAIKMRLLPKRRRRARARMPFRLLRLHGVSAYGSERVPRWRAASSDRCGRGGCSRSYRRTSAARGGQLPD